MLSIASVSTRLSPTKFYIINIIIIELSLIPLLAYANDGMNNDDARIFAPFACQKSIEMRLATCKHVHMFDTL